MTAKNIEYHHCFPVKTMILKGTAEIIQQDMNATDRRYWTAARYDEI